MTKEELKQEAEEYLKKDGTKAEQILNILNEISPLKITLKQLPFILAVIQQAFIDGAEPREKRIEELEKEIEKIKKTYRKQRNKRIDELQKANAELKEKLKPENCLKSLAKSGLVKFTCENGNEHDQLTKAKELLKRYVKIYVNPYPEEEIELRNEAEQFLSEVEK